MFRGFTNFKEAVHKLSPHDHLCLICETLEERAAVFVDFFIGGLERNERCIYITDISSTEEIRASLEAAGIDAVASEAAGELVILSEREIFGREGSFNPDQMVALLIAEAEKAITEGYRGLCMVSEMGWVLRRCPGSERLLEYEARLNRDFFPRYPCTGICQYDRRMFDPKVIKDLLMTHPLVVHGERIYHNFFYVPPEYFLEREGAASEVDLWLERLKQEDEARERLYFFADVLEHSAQAFCAVDVDGRIIASNRAFCELTGYSREELEGVRSIGDLVPFTPLQGARVREELNSIGNTQCYEKECIRSDGLRVPVKLFCSQICDDKGAYSDPKRPPIPI